MTGGVGGEPRQDFRLDIQGLRAIAVGAVVLYHAGVPFLAGGYVGVDVFFVISGFLITTHLLTQLERDGKIDFGEFYARRARRILPAAFVVLFLSVIAALIWYPPLLFDAVWRDGAATALYVPNVLFGLDGTNYLAEGQPSLFQHYWSLGIEEQFYLAWPLVLALCWRWIRTPRIFAGVLVALVSLSFLACVVLTFRSQPWAFFLLPTRAWELGIGGLAAYVLKGRPSVLGPRVAAVVGWLGVAGIVGACVLFDDLTPFPGYWAAVPVLSTAAVILAGATPTRPGPAGVLSLQGMVFVGTISYSLYLVHWPAVVVPQVVAGYANPLPLWVTLGIAVACVPTAWLIYRFIEDPMRKVNFLARARPRRTLLLALAGSGVSVAAAASSLVALSLAPLDAGRAAPASAPTVPPVATGYVPSNLTPPLAEVKNDGQHILAGGCHADIDARTAQDCVIGAWDAPRIALVGDSHAAQWLPALKAVVADTGFAIQVYTKSACPAASITIIRNTVPYTACDAWRDDVIADLNAQSPAAVLLAGYAHHPVEFVGSRGSVREKVWAAGLAETLDAIRAPSAVIADTPRMGFTPSICLSVHLEDPKACGRAKVDAVDESLRAAERAAAEADGSAFIDLVDYFCTEDECPPVVGNILVYRDENHMTTAFSAALAEALAGELAKVVPISEMSRTSGRGGLDRHRD